MPDSVNTVPFASGSTQSPITLSDDEEDVVTTIDLSPGGHSVHSASTSTRKIKPLPQRSKGKQRAVEPIDVIDLSEFDDADYDDACDTDDLPQLLDDATGLLSDLEKADAEMARALALEEEKAYINSVQERDRKNLDRDEKIAQKLAQKEETAYKKLLKTVDEKKEGVVFSVVVNVPSDTLEDGSPAHPDDLDRFSRWKEQFEKSAAGCHITKFHWFVNHELENRFNRARDKLQELGRPTEEVQLFHGTAAPNIDKIRQGGLRIGGTNGHQVVNGSAFGIGIYLAEHALTSVGYAVGANRIFACRVLPGAVTKNMADIQGAPKAELCADKYDSFHTNDSVYVVRHADLVLPCYMIEYTLGYPVPGRYGYPGGVYPPFGGPVAVVPPMWNGAIPPYLPLGAQVALPLVNNGILAAPYNALARPLPYVGGAGAALQVAKMDGVVKRTKRGNVDVDGPSEPARRKKGRRS